MVALAFVLLVATVNLDALRTRAATSARRATETAESAEKAVTRRDAGESALEALKRSIDEGNGGFRAEWRVRKQSAEVRKLVEETVAASDEARRARAEASRDRESLRDALFAEASARTSQGDVAAREGRTPEALARHREAATLLAEASRLAPLDDEVDPWAGLESEVPLTGMETASERAAIATAYLATADRVALRLQELRTRLGAAEEAVLAWTRLARYRGVLERGGGVLQDPTPRRDRLAELVRHGERLEGMLRQRAADVAAPRMGASP